MKEHCPVSPAVVQGKEEEEDEAASAAASVSELRGHMAPLCLGFRQLAGVVATAAATVEKTTGLAHVGVRWSSISLMGYSGSNVLVLVL